MMIGEYEKALESLGEALRLQPDHQLVQERLRLTRARMESVKQLDAFEEEAARRPEDYAAQLKLARLYNMLARHEDAERLYKQAIRLRPNDYQPYNPLAIDYAEAGRYADAVAYYRRGAAIKQ